MTALTGLPAISGTTAPACCTHCASPTRNGAAFCCNGCRAAHRLISDLGLDLYYQRRRFDTAQRQPRPDEDLMADATSSRDLSAWIKVTGEDEASITMMVDGLHCGACVWLIEQTLLHQPGVIKARVSLTSRRLSLTWQPSLADAAKLRALVQSLGYRLVPMDPACLAAQDDRETRQLLVSMAVAGFAAGNIMLLSVSIWSGGTEMAATTRNLFHWISALIAIPAIAYAGQPFFRPAWRALRAGRSNMDVPISLAIILAPTISLYETFTSGTHAYFDSAVTLLFFLLIGRYLDQNVRRAARASAEQLLALTAASASKIFPDGSIREVPPRDLQAGDRVLVQAGFRLPADGTIIEGFSDADFSLISGESVPVRAAPGMAVYAGVLNLTAPLTVNVDKVGDGTLLADITRLMEAAEAQRGQYVRLADKVARYYSPVVHVTALATFLAWLIIGHLPWQDALLIAIAVLIITCPCALALAIPVVQVIASQRLLRAGVLLKSADALEKLRHIDRIIFDKTGTLTLGRLDLQPGYHPDQLRQAAAIAANSRHPLARALVSAQNRLAGPVTPATDVTEIPGQGLEWRSPAGLWRLGSASFTHQADEPGADHLLYLRDAAGTVTCFRLADQLRPDAAAVITALQHFAPVELCSGDRSGPVQAMAEQAGIVGWKAGQTPAGKASYLNQLRADGCRVLMIGDGLNDAPALSAAYVSMSPASGAEISQNAADLVFQGDSLMPILFTLQVARRSDRLMRQNLLLALGYNFAAVPLAIAGWVTPMIAAIAMSSSSILVVLNALRLNRTKARCNPGKRDSEVK